MILISVLLAILTLYDCTLALPLRLILKNNVTTNIQDKTEEKAVNIKYRIPNIEGVYKDGKSSIDVYIPNAGPISTELSLDGNDILLPLSSTKERLLLPYLYKDRDSVIGTQVKTATFKDGPLIEDLQFANDYGDPLKGALGMKGFTKQLQEKGLILNRIVVSKFPWIEFGNSTTSKIHFTFDMDKTETEVLLKSFKKMKTKKYPVTLDPLLASWGIPDHDLFLEITKGFTINSDLGLMTGDCSGSTETYDFRLLGITFERKDIEFPIYDSKTDQVIRRSRSSGPSGMPAPASSKKQCALNVKFTPEKNVIGATFLRNRDFVLDYSANLFGIL